MPRKGYRKGIQNIQSGKATTNTENANSYNVTIVKNANYINILYCRNYYQTDYFAIIIATRFI